MNDPDVRAWEDGVQQCLGLNRSARQTLRQTLQWIWAKSTTIPNSLANHVKLDVTKPGAPPQPVRDRETQQVYAEILHDMRDRPHHAFVSVAKIPTKTDKRLDRALKLGEPARKLVVLDHHVLAAGDFVAFDLVFALNDFVGLGVDELALDAVAGLTIEGVEPNALRRGRSGI
jgi:hypothetical protein